MYILYKKNKNLSVEERVRLLKAHKDRINERRRDDRNEPYNEFFFEIARKIEFKTKDIFGPYIQSDP